MSGVNAWTEMMLLWCWQSLVLVGLILVIARVARSTSAGQRHQLWLLGLVLIAVLPAANALVRWGYIALPAISPFASMIQLPGPTPATADDRPSPALPMEIRSTAAASTPSRSGPPSFPLKAVLFGLWATGVLISAGRTFAAWSASRQLRKEARPAGIPGCSVRVGYSAAVQTPILAGVLRPMILLPDAMAGWTVEERQAVILHEQAHFERRDHLVNLLQAWLGAILFFHPVVRLALGRLAAERELACDEHVLAAGVRPGVYMDAILKVAECGLTPQNSFYSAFNSPRKILERRIQMIAMHQPSGSKRFRWLLLMKVSAVVSVAFLLPSARFVTAQSTPLAPVSQLQALQPLTPAAAQAVLPQLSSATPAVPVRVREPQAAAIAPTAGLQQNFMVTMTPVITPVQVPAATRLSGTIFDQTGAALPGVSVTLRNPASGQVEQSAVTGGTGGYAFPQVSSGDYIFQASLPGFMEHRRSLQLRPGGANSQNAFLLVGGGSVQVEVSAARPAAPTPAAVPSPMRIGGVISAPQLIQSTKPVYPPGAQARDLQDSVSLLGVVGADGRVASLQLDPARGVTNWELVRAAIAAVQMWQFRPATLNGVPVDFPMTIVVNFTLVDEN